MEQSKMYLQSVLEAAAVIERATAPLLALPFDTARELYSVTVHIGFIERLMLAWTKFERTLDALEKLTLGPWARRV